MKTIVWIVFVFLIANQGNYQKIEIPENITVNTLSDPCPPFKSEAKKDLKSFLTEEAFQAKRQKLGIVNLSINEVSYLKNGADNLACQEIRKIYSWPLENFNRVYFESNKYYFVVDDHKQPSQPEEEGVINISTGYDVLRILDKDFNHVDSVLF